MRAVGVDFGDGARAILEIGATFDRAAPIRTAQSGRESQESILLVEIHSFRNTPRAYAAAINKKLGGYLLTLLREGVDRRLPVAGEVAETIPTRTQAV